MDSPFQRLEPYERDYSPWLLFCYHKVGTVLLRNVFRSVANAFGLRFCVVLGRAAELPQDRDVVLFAHSLIDPTAIACDYRGVHLVRDPRDVVVSGYLYHKRCKEKWCVNSDLSPQTPIKHPRVPYSQEYRPEDWKKTYLASLNGMSYQDNLVTRSQEEGLQFELDRYGRWTTEAMDSWRFGDSRVLEMRFESIMLDFDRYFARLFEHLGLHGPDLIHALSLARHHDIGRMSNRALAKNAHVTSRHTSRWARVFSERHRSVFKKRHGKTLLKLGYEQDSRW